MYRRVFLVFFFPPSVFPNVISRWLLTSSVTFRKVTEGRKKRTAVEIWASSKVGSVFLTLNYIERELICFLWQQSSGICLSHCILSPPEHAYVGNTAYGKDAMSKKPVSFLWDWNAISLLSTWKLALVNMKEESLLLCCQGAPSCKTLLANLQLLQTDVFCNLRKAIDSN